MTSPYPESLRLWRSKSGGPASPSTTAYMNFDGRISSDAYDHWRDAHPALNTVYAITPGPTPFHVKAASVALGRASVTRFDFSGMTYERDEARIRVDDNDGVVVQLTETGGMSGAAGTTQFAAGPGAAVFVDRTRPFLNHSLDTRGIAIGVPRELLGATNARALHGKVISGGAYGLLSDYAAWLTGAFTRMPLSAVERTEAALAAILIAAFQDDRRLDPAAAETVGVLAVDRVRRHIERHALTGPIDMKTIVAASGVSRSSLYRLMAPLGGVQNLIWMTRCEAALHALLNPAHRGRLADIATEFGFTSQAHFSRRFKDRFGFSPSNLRPF